MRRCGWRRPPTSVCLASKVSGATPLTDRKATVYHEPRLHALTPAERVAVFDASWHFVSTAVARRHLDEAWALLGPEMRAGQTRKQSVTLAESSE